MCWSIIFLKKETSDNETVSLLIKIKKKQVNCYEFHAYILHAMTKPALLTFNIILAND